jgi:hypothetical protein
MELKELEQKYQAGVKIIRERGYYPRLLDEAHYLIKYIDSHFFLELFSENLFCDIRGVFGSFVRQDLKKVYNDMKNNPTIPIGFYLEQKYMNLVILQKCASNIRYQVKSLIRLRKVKELSFKSRFFTEVSRKMEGEIQENYKLLERNYKVYFRERFSRKPSSEDKISLKCVDETAELYDKQFLQVFNRFLSLSQAINFVREVFSHYLEIEIRNHLATVFYERQDKLERVIDYFINDLKRNFIHTMSRHLRKGRSFEWIRTGFQQFIDSERFEMLLRRVILQTLSIIRRNNSQNGITNLKK